MVFQAQWKKHQEQLLEYALLESRKSVKTVMKSFDLEDESHEEQSGMFLHSLQVHCMAMLCSV